MHTLLPHPLHWHAPLPPALRHALKSTLQFCQVAWLQAELQIPVTSQAGDAQEGWEQGSKGRRACKGKLCKPAEAHFSSLAASLDLWLLTSGPAARNAPWQAGWRWVRRRQQVQGRAQRVQPRPRCRPCGLQRGFDPGCRPCWSRSRFGSCCDCAPPCCACGACDACLGCDCGCGCGCGCGASAASALAPRSRWSCCSCRVAAASSANGAADAPGRCSCRSSQPCHCGPRCGSAAGPLMPCLPSVLPAQPARCRGRLPARPAQRPSPRLPWLQRCAAGCGAGAWLHRLRLLHLTQLAPQQLQPHQQQQRRQQASVPAQPPCQHRRRRLPGAAPARQRAAAAGRPAAVLGALPAAPAGQAARRQHRHRPRRHGQSLLRWAGRRWTQLAEGAAAWLGLPAEAQQGRLCSPQGARPQLPRRSRRHPAARPGAVLSRPAAAAAAAQPPAPAAAAAEPAAPERACRGPSTRQGRAGR